MQLLEVDSSNTNIGQSNNHGTVHRPIEGVGFFDCVAASGSSEQNEDLFLDVRRKVVLPQNLRAVACLSMLDSLPI